MVNKNTAKYVLTIGMGSPHAFCRWRRTNISLPTAVRPHGYLQIFKYRSKTYLFQPIYDRTLKTMPPYYLSFSKDTICVFLNFTKYKTACNEKSPTHISIGDFLYLVAIFSNEHLLFWIVWPQLIIGIHFGLRNHK